MEKEEAIDKLQHDLKYFQLELVNREQNYNALFSSNPTVGVMDPFTGTTSTRSAHSGLKVQATWLFIIIASPAREPETASLQRQLRQNGPRRLLNTLALQPARTDPEPAQASQAQELINSLHHSLQSSTYSF